MLMPLRSQHDSAAGQPLFESLEERLLLAGTVTVSTSGSTLVLTGDDGHNEIVVDAFGLQPDQFRVAGVNGTAINGPAVVSNIKNLKANLGAGDDSLTFTLAILLGGVAVDAGEGTNTLTLFGFGVGTNVSYKGGPHFDQINVETGTIAGKLAVNTGDGGSVVNLRNNAIVTKGLSISSLAGQDELSISTGSRVGKMINVNAGTDPAVFLLDAARIEGKLNWKNGAAGLSTVGFVNGAVSTGAISINAAGPINIGVDNSDLQSSLKAKLSGGADTLSFANSATVGGNVSVIFGDGANSFSMNASTLNAKLAIKGGNDGNSLDFIQATLGDFRFDGGAGIDEFTANGTWFKSRFSFKGGMEMDKTTFENNSVVSGDARIDLAAGAGPNMQGVWSHESEFHGRLNISSGNGWGTVVLGSGTIVGGDLNINHSKSTSDSITIDSASFMSRTTIKTSSNDDIIDIDRLGQPGAAIFVGPVTIQTGDGNDTVRLGNAILGGGGPDLVDFRDSVKLDGGKGDADILRHNFDGNAVFAVVPDLRNFETII